MNSLQWMALYCALVAIWAGLRFCVWIYRFWIVDLGEKARLYEEMCERLEGLDSVEWW